MQLKDAAQLALKKMPSAEQEAISQVRIGFSVSVSLGFWLSSFLHVSPFFSPSNLYACIVQRQSSSFSTIVPSKTVNIETCERLKFVYGGLMDKQCVKILLSDQTFKIVTLVSFTHD